MLRLFIAGLAFAALAAAAQADTLFANPFGDAAFYRTMRGALPAAHTRLRFETTVTAPGTAPETRIQTWDLADDWALVHADGQSLLLDYRLNRNFAFQGRSFTTDNATAMLVFRVMESQNRLYQGGFLKQAGLDDESFRPCNVESEFGIAIPGAPSDAKIIESDGRVRVTCDGRETGSFAPGDGAAPPATFWPTWFHFVPMHPTLFQRLKAGGHVPHDVDVSFLRVKDKVRVQWRLVGAERVETAYPLVLAMQNMTAGRLDALIGPEAPQLAADTIGGRAQGGVPTEESWHVHLLEIERRDGAAAAAMLILPTLNMFPGLYPPCTAKPQHALCSLSQRLQEIGRKDPAPIALMEIGAAEQANDADAAIAAMNRAQASPLRDHPALGASFALALLRFDAKALEKARKAGLPTDIAALQARAVTALPYNPTYWSDIGDRYLASYAMQDAFLLYDVAYALPMPDAVAKGPGMSGKRQQFDGLRAAFPDAGLPQ